jgi:hypothetical protein
MPRPLKPLNPFGSWPALFGAALRQLRLAFCSSPSMSQADLGKRIGYPRAMVSAIERGALRPDEKFVEACERELVLAVSFAPCIHGLMRSGTTGLASASVPLLTRCHRPSSHQILPISQRRAFLEEISDGRAEPLDLPRHVDSSRIDPGTLETIAGSVERLCRQYSNTRPALLLPRAVRRLHDLNKLLDGRLTLAQHRELIVAGGWVSLLLAALYFDEEDREAAEASRDAAYHFGREVGHNEIVAWAFEAPAWFALAEGRLRDAVDFACAGKEHAELGTSVLVALSMQEARAWARLHDRTASEQAMRQANTAIQAVCRPSTPSTTSPSIRLRSPSTLPPAMSGSTSLTVPKNTRSG